jgi:glyoxylase I family protein
LGFGPNWAIFRISLCEGHEVLCEDNEFFNFACNFARVVIPSKTVQAIPPANEQGAQGMKLEHVAINVPDPAAQAEWFVQHLGMRMVVAGTTPPYMHFVVDEAGSMLELYNNSAAPMPDYANMNPFNLHIAFASDNIEADRERLLAAGATAAGEITTSAAGDKLCFLRTPWYVPFQFVQRQKPLI